PAFATSPSCISPLGKNCESDFASIPFCQAQQCLRAPTATIHRAKSTRFCRRFREHVRPLDFPVVLEGGVPATPGSRELAPPRSVFLRAAFRVRNREADRAARFRPPARFPKLPEQNRVSLSKSPPRPFQRRSTAASACSHPRQEAGQAWFRAIRSA